MTAAKSAPDASRWAFDHRGDLELWVTVSADGHDAEKFLARFFWMEYPGNSPPSVKFVDPASKRLDVSTAWPIAEGFRPQSFDICANWTAEGFSVHPEWRDDPRIKWPADGNAILRAISILQHKLDISYAGRFKG